MSELQSDYTYEDDIDEATIEPVNDTKDEVIEDPIQDSDLATETEKTEQTEDSKQEAINKAINKKHFEKMEAIRRAEAAEAKLAEIEKARLDNERQALERIPELPDPYDDDYQQKLSERDQAITRKAQFEAQQNAYNYAEQQKQQAAQLVRQQELQTKAQAFIDKAKSYGMTEEEVADSARRLNEMGLSNELREDLLGDVDAPLIYKHLANNPLELEQLRFMTPYQQARHIDKVVRDKALLLKPKTSKAPAPATDINGGSADINAGKYAHIKGAKFE